MFAIPPQSQFSALGYYVNPDPNSLAGPARNGKMKPSNPPPLNNLHSARSGDRDIGTSDATAITNDQALQAYHSSSTVLMLENALAAVRNDASQLPLSDILHASTVIRDLENVLRERLSRSLGDDEQMEVNAGTSIEKE